MTIYHFIPWNSDKKIGKSYNDCMNMIGEDDWACFIDGDAVHTTVYFGKRIEDIVSSNPSYSLFTCYTNRIGCPYQIPQGVNQKSNDQEYHRNFGENLWTKNQKSIEDITNQKIPLSGVLILISKKTWLKCGKFKEVGMLGVDNDIHVKVKNNNLKVGLMKGIYVQHWYRGKEPGNRSHLL